MPELPVVDKAERERIRQSLRRYKEEHGGIGDPELQQRIMYSLGCGESAVPLSTLQRFLRGTHHTDDLMVKRYAKFLSIVAPPGFADEAGAAISKDMVYPVSSQPKAAIEYQGRYEVSVTPYGGREGEEDAAMRQWGFLLLPARDPRFLTVRTFPLKPNAGDGSGEPVIEYATGSGLFMRCGLEQYLLMNVAFANAWCSFVTEIDANPLTLQGLLLQTTSPGIKSKPAYELRMSQVAGPNIKQNT